jgi:hypothetical protein
VIENLRILSVDGDAGESVEGEVAYTDVHVETLHAALPGLFRTFVIVASGLHVVAQA